MQIIFLSGTKCLRLPQYVNDFLVWHKKIGPAQNILGPLKGQVKKRVLIWICINGSPDEAKRYNYEMYFEGYYEPGEYKVYKSRDKVIRNDVIRFQVKTLDENPLDIIRGKTVKMVFLDDFLENKFVITIYDLEKPKKTWAQILLGN